GLPVQPVQQSVQEPRAVSVSASSWIDNGTRLGRGNPDLCITCVDDRTFCATGDDERADLSDDIACRQSRAILQELPFVLVHSHPIRLLYETPQLFAAEHGQSLSRIEDERNAGGSKLRSVLQHTLLAVG